MTTFLRQITLLCVAITLLSHLLPEGSMKGTGRMVMGIVFLFFMISSLMQLLSAPLPNVDQAAFSLFQAQRMPSTGSYLDAVIASGSRQAASIAEKAAQQAGYPNAYAQVAMDHQGSIQRVTISLWDSISPASTLGEKWELPQPLCEAVAQALNIPQAIIEGGSGGIGNGA